MPGFSSGLAGVARPRIASSAGAARRDSVTGPTSASTPRSWTSARGGRAGLLRVSSKRTGGPTSTSPPAAMAASASGRPSSASRSRRVRRRRRSRLSDPGDRGCGGPREARRSRQRCFPRRFPPSTPGAPRRATEQPLRGRHPVRPRCGRALPPGSTPTSGRGPPRPRGGLPARHGSALAPRRRAQVPGAPLRAVTPSSPWRGSRPRPTRCPRPDRRWRSERRGRAPLGLLPCRRPPAQGRRPRLFHLPRDSGGILVCRELSF